jgi:hypothetical protein
MFSSANVVVNVTLCNLEHRYESSYFRQFISFANINSTTNSKSYSDVSKITLRFLFFAKKWHTLASFSLSHIHSIIYESKKNYSTTKKNYESKKKKLCECRKMLADFYDPCMFPDKEVRLCQNKLKERAKNTFGCILNCFELEKNIFCFVLK